MLNFWYWRWKALLGIFHYVYACMVWDNFFYCFKNKRTHYNALIGSQWIAPLCSYATNLAFYYARNYSLDWVSLRFLASYCMHSWGAHSFTWASEFVIWIWNSLHSGCFSGGLFHMYLLRWLMLLALKLHLTPKYFFCLNESLHLFGTYCVFLN